MGKWLAKFKEENFPERPGVPTDITDTGVNNKQTTVRGQVVQLYRMKATCQTAGHCLALTQEADCNLYPIRSGWCRERISNTNSVKQYKTERNGKENV